MKPLFLLYCAFTATLICLLHAPAAAATPSGAAVCWERKTTADGLSPYTTLDFYTSNPLGPHVQIYIQHGKAAVQYLVENGIKWVIISHTASVSLPDLVARLQYLIKTIGKKRVEQLSFWPVNQHGYPYNRGTFFQHNISAGMFIAHPDHLKQISRTTYLGHPCELLESHKTPAENHGSMLSRYWWDLHTHMIWRRDYINLPSSHSAAPPTRQSERVLWLKRIPRIPPHLLAFPPGTRVIVPMCMGSIHVPPGAFRVPLPPDAAYLGFSLKRTLAMVQHLDPQNRPFFAKQAKREEKRMK